LGIGNDLLGGIGMAWKDEQKKIREIVERREIPQLVHFTNTNNLHSIIKHGLVPRSLWVKHGIVGSINDERRHEGHHVVNLTVTTPNWYLFNKFRNEYPHNDWVLLIISPQVLYDIDYPEIHAFTYNPSISGSEEQQKSRYSWMALNRPPLVTFYQTNAANFNGTRGSDARAFELMFAEEVDISTSSREKPPIRRQKDKEPCLTTDVQAEIAIADIVPKTYITGCAFLNKKSMEHWKKSLQKEGIEAVFIGDIEDKD
jgi:hypothetical protein